jgi:hypothetical protein
VPRIQKIIETLEAERAEVHARLEWLDQRISEFREDIARRVDSDAHTTPAPPVRSGRRATAKRASARRAVARSVKRDLTEDIIQFLQKHPGSTAGDVAKGLNLDRNSVAGRLAVMSKAGDIAKAKRGYVSND